MSTTYNPATLEFIKKDAARRRKQRAMASVLGLLLVGGIGAGGWLAYSHHQTAAKAEVAQQITAEIKPGTNPRDAWEKLRSAVDAGTLTEDQARELGRQAMEKQMQATMDGYFATPAKDRDKYLDKLLDEAAKRQAEWQRNRPTTGPATRPWGNRNGGPTSRPAGGPGGGDQAAREAAGRARADNTSPMQRAQQAEFRAALMARAKERGMTPPRGMGGGGGRGGRGG